MKLSPQVNPMDITQKVAETSNLRRQEADKALDQLIETKKMIQQMRQAKEAARQHNDTQERLREQFLTEEAGRNERARATHDFNERKFRQEQALEMAKYGLQKDKIVEEMAEKQIKLDNEKKAAEGEALAKKYLNMQKKTPTAVENARRRV